MALTAFQRGVCRLIAGNRIASGESYVAGAVALNELIAAPRLSRDVDLFHDTEEALQASWDADRWLLERSGYRLEVLRERPSFVEARVGRGDQSLLLEWARDSAYRFFPLVEHPDFGLTLHPFDLATNKVLALVGRLEVRDWIDVIRSDERIQPLGYLAWAACGKDPGFSPEGVLDHAARARYSSAEVRELSFATAPPSPVGLARQWHALLEAARQTVPLLPADQVGRCVLAASGELFRGSPEELEVALAGGALRFHEGSIRGALPQLIDPDPPQRATGEL
jgi:hypothetical protein